ncbi:hypothetical protein XELAEV_18033501mg [Xenopus laevis]|uniref:Uncharacterized protein n=1 Tax=Xenopus laevis TaxID=8355 RepID=A0A974CKV6_XENLA|nr:hypothetical protein XELAEV_18033501mg [Xenopus laevis]
MIYGPPLVSDLLLPGEPQKWNLLWKPVFDPIMDQESVQSPPQMTIEVQTVNVVDQVQTFVECVPSIFLCPLVWSI